MQQQSDGLLEVGEILNQYSEDCTTNAEDPHFMPLGTQDRLTPRFMQEQLTTSRMITIPDSVDSTVVRTTAAEHDQSPAETDGGSETRLLVHYRDIICHYMMPTIDMARNPWLQVYSALALYGKPTPCQIALRQALVAVAACHQEQTCKISGSGLPGQAALYRTRASQSIQDLLETELSRLDRQDRQSLLAATMALISTDVFGTDRAGCVVQIQNARRVILLTGDAESWQSDDVSNVLWQIFCCYHLVISTALTQSAAPKQGRAESDAERTMTLGHLTARGSFRTSSRTELHLLGLPTPIPSNILYVLGLSFGIAAKTFSLLCRTVRLTDECANYTMASSWSLELADEVHTLHDILRSEAEKFDSGSDDHMAEMIIPGLEEERFSASDGIGITRQYEGLYPLHPVVSKEILKNHQECFHYALLLYFYRTFPEELLKSPEPLQDCQVYVGKILDCLETIESLTGTLPIKPANTLWPAFVACAEAIDVASRHRALIWLSKMAVRGLGNIARAKQMIMEIWRRVDRTSDVGSGSSLCRRGLGPIDWRDVMAEQESFIMLT